VKTKTIVDTSKLLKRMARYEEVTGKTVADSLRRSARLLAVSMAYSTPPYGNKPESKKLGERAVQNDILRVYTPSEPIKNTYPTNKTSLREQVERFFTRDVKLKERIIEAIAEGRQAELSGILKNISGFAKLNVSKGVDVSIHAKTRNAYGRVRKGWKGREIVMESNQLERYIKDRQSRVGMTKAAWASAALKVKAPVGNSLRGFPAWVRRHVDKAPASVTDESEGMLPLITLTSKLPWADKAFRPADAKEAMRIARQKFYKSMGTEIHHALKAAHS
jgi:hypothetical protein